MVKKIYMLFPIIQKPRENVSSGPSSQAIIRNLTPIEFMVSELSGATQWEFVDVFLCEDICKHHLTGQIKDGFCKKTVFFLILFFGNLPQNQVFIFGPTNSRVLGSLAVYIYIYTQYIFLSLEANY